MILKANTLAVGRTVVSIPKKFQLLKNQPFPNSAAEGGCCIILFMMILYTMVFTRFGAETRVAAAVRRKAFGQRHSRIAIHARTACSVSRASRSSAHIAPAASVVIAATAFSASCPRRRVHQAPPTTIYCYC